jgi:uncharacterized protein (TIGR02246 family)
MGTNHDDDLEAIGGLLATLGRGFATLDAEPLVPLYAEDADWTNAFGTCRHGRGPIIDYLRDLFADARFGAGRQVGQPQGSIRLLGDGVAVAKTYLEREGQQTMDGGTLPVRRNHLLKVLEKQEGTWRIVSEMYMDARDESTLEPAPRTG